MTRVMFKLLLALAFALSLVGAAERAVLAAPPANDLRSGATLVTVGFSESLDTTAATTDADDAYLNTKAGCNFPATDASVWYQFVGTGETFRFEVFRSDYSASILIAEGDFNNPHYFGCGIGGIDFSTGSGQTYYMLVFDDQRDGVGVGGMLNISISAVPPLPPATATVGVNRFGTVNARTGLATISGTYTCSNADSFSLSGEARQEVGRFVALGYFDFHIESTCDGGVHTWSADVYPYDPLNRKFVGGKAMTLAVAYASGTSGYGYAYTEQVVILRGKK